MNGDLDRLGSWPAIRRGWSSRQGRAASGRCHGDHGGQQRTMVNIVRYLLPSGDSCSTGGCWRAWRDVPCASSTCSQCRRTWRVLEPVVMRYRARKLSNQDWVFEERCRLRLKIYAKISKPTDYSTHLASQAAIHQRNMAHLLTRRGRWPARPCSPADASFDTTDRWNKTLACRGQSENLDPGSWFTRRPKFPARMCRPYQAAITHGRS